MSLLKILNKRKLNIFIANLWQRVVSKTYFLFITLDTFLVLGLFYSKNIMHMKIITVAPFLQSCNYFLDKFLNKILKNSRKYS